MSYDFKSLSWPEFEDLSRDLIGKEIGVRFEVFTAGPDGGKDGRYSRGGLTILQAKHYSGSSFSQLKAAVKGERQNIDTLKPDRYLLSTSQFLSSDRKDELAAEIGSALKASDDIFTGGDLNALLRKFSEVLRAHVKLWLGSAAVLERVLHAALHEFTRQTEKEIRAKLSVYAQNPSLEDANKKLDSEHVVIISGPPGVGKTTLAEMLAYTYIADEWELIAIRSLDDGFTAINDTKKQVFFFDDFLGKVALDRNALSQKDSDLARFIKRIRASPNARFILTTRAHIFEEARQVSEHLADKRLDVTKYVLDVGVYTRRIKARILYNHMAFSDLPQEYLDALASSDLLTKIVDHKNYNPRVIEWMTDPHRLDGIMPEKYAEAFVAALDNPSELWSIAFKNHIDASRRNLLFSLFFESEYGTAISSLRNSYNSLHPRLAAKYGSPQCPTDFDDALKSLEGGFVRIVDGAVYFINPSLRDYLKSYLRDVDLLKEGIYAATEIDWLRNVWRQAKAANLSDQELDKLAREFVGKLNLFTESPVFSTYQSEGRTIRYRSDLQNTARLQLLLEVAEAASEGQIQEKMLTAVSNLAVRPVGSYDASYDGTEAITLIAGLRRDEYPVVKKGAEMADEIEKHFIKMLEEGVSSEDLASISSTFSLHIDDLSEGSSAALNTVITAEFKAVRDVIDDIDSDSTLEEHADLLRTLAEEAGIDSFTLDKALQIIEDRRAQLEERSNRSGSPSIASRRVGDSFDNGELSAMFSSLGSSRKN